jgi:dolichol-phosphate hexosyltransferase
MKKLTVMIPCYNEESGIVKVIKRIPKKRLHKLGYKTEVLVIDNNSNDNTTAVARKAGAKVVSEKRQGKGYAIRKGVRSISSDIDLVVMLDGDNTYDPKEMLRMIEPLDSGFCDVVIGTRLGGKISKGSMTLFNRTGNWFFTFLVRTWYHGNVTDVCTGYFSWKKSVLKKLSKHLESNGFSIEMEMITKMAKMNFQIYSIPITYDNRAGDSSLRPIHDGRKILKAYVRNLFWKPGVRRR